jgi:hypothetical protein
MMAGVVVQRARLLMFIERVIQLVRHGHGADPQQHGCQQPGNESRSSLHCVEHEACKFAVTAGQRQVN